MIVDREYDKKKILVQAKVFFKDWFFIKTLQPKDMKNVLETAHTTLPGRLFLVLWSFDAYSKKISFSRWQ